MNYANAAFNASDRALYTLLPIASHDNDDDDDRKRRKEEIEEDRPSASCCFANYLYTNKTAYRFAIYAYLLLFPPSLCKLSL